MPGRRARPFRLCSIEERGGGLQVALLVGMAGKSHWSASVEFDPTADARDCSTSPAARPTCRNDSPGAAIACLRPPHAESPARAVISPDHGQPFQLAVETLADVGAARLILAGNELAIEPLDVNSAAGAADDSLAVYDRLYRAGRRGAMSERLPSCALPCLAYFRLVW